MQASQDAGRPAMHIVVENLAEHEVLAYPLVLLEGRVAGWDAVPERQNLFLEARLDHLRGSVWPIAASSGHFKALVLLPAPGAFAVLLRVAGVCKRVFHVSFAPPSAPKHVVQFHYQKCSDGAGEGFDAPPDVDNSDAAAIRKIRFCALLLQTAMAELLCAAGLPRRTFALSLAADGLPDVTLLRSSFTNAHARSVDGQELIRLVRKDLPAPKPSQQLKHAVVLGCSHYNPETRRAEGHTALGGGYLGVFGSCGLHTWPAHLGELSYCCLDNQRIDQCVLLDDSCYRGSYWANFSTGIGALLHELGHTLGLGHATSGIMARGFDDMNRLFSVYEVNARSSQAAFWSSTPQGWLELNHSAVHEVSGRGGAHWHVVSAQLLHHSPWISGQAMVPHPGPTVSWDDTVRGPVGNAQGNGTQVPLVESVAAAGDELGAVRLHAAKYLNNLESFSRAEVAEMTRCEPLRVAGDTHWFVLLAGEYITRVDVRAMAWVDGLQLHTNLRSSRWFGGGGGKLHVLQAADGWRVSSFFGSKGNTYVGKLGLRCLPLSSRPASQPLTLLSPDGPISSFPAAGKALEGGAKKPFSVSPSTVAAVVVRCGKKYVEAPFRALEHEEYAERMAKPGAFRSNEHVLELVAGEKLVKVEVSSGHWVDAVRLTTNMRVSPWFGGGNGPNYTVLECPPGHHICGFHGIHGNKYVGSLGILYRADGRTSNALKAPLHTQASLLEEQVCHSQRQPFAVMSEVKVTTKADEVAGVPLGILVAVQDGAVVFVQSFDNFHAFNELVNYLHATLLVAGENSQVHCVSLTPGEKLVQIDVSFRPADDYYAVTAIDGVCFHTTARCSSWFGLYRESSLRFFMAPQGSSVLQLCGNYTSSVLTDVTGIVGDYRESTEVLNADGRVQVDTGSYDIRLETNAPAFGIESVLLVYKNGGDNRDAHAWTWEQSGQACPRTWRVPHKMLEARIPDNDRRTLFRDCLVGAVDSGGATTRTPAPACIATAP